MTNEQIAIMQTIRTAKAGGYASENTIDIVLISEYLYDVMNGPTHNHITIYGYQIVIYRSDSDLIQKIKELSQRGKFVVVL